MRPRPVEHLEIPLLLPEHHIRERAEPRASVLGLLALVLDFLSRLP
jgi:hypothetical protein